MPDAGDKETILQFHVVIAGAGVAGLEAALALQDIAGDSVDVTVLAPNSEFVYRPMSVREPFSYAGAKHYPIAPIVADAGAELIEDSFAWVDRDKRIVHTAEGREIKYDALVIALGAKAYDLYPNATTVDDRSMEDLYHGVIQDVEMGYVRKLAFIMPPGKCWPLPIYELALMTAERAYAMCVDVDITIVTPERAPLEVFGDEASAAVGELLTERGIGVETHAKAHVPSSRKVIIEPGKRDLDVDRVIALPELFGPSVRGIPGGDQGFLPVDQHCQVIDVEGIFAVGDAANALVKHGGLSAQQADVAAAQIAHLAGAGPEVGPLWPHVEGMLLTGRDPLYIRAKLVGWSGFSSEVSTTPLWSPPAKIQAKYLSPYLDKLDRATH